MLIASLFLAGFIEATSGDVEPDWLYALIIPGWVGGLIALGYLGGWQALPLFTISYACALAVHSVAFYERDPRCVEWCGAPGADSLVLVLPFLLVPVAIGAAPRSRDCSKSVTSA